MKELLKQLKVPSHQTSSAKAQAEFLFQELAPEEQFSRLLRTAAAKGLPLAAWRLPGKAHPCLVIDLGGEAARLQPDLETLPPGFLVAPYATELLAPDAAENPQCRFIKADLFWSGDANALEQVQLLSAEKKSRAEAFLEECLQSTLPGVPYPVGSGTATESSPEQYLRLVEASVEAIKSGDFQKNVCARAKAVALPKTFRLEHFFSTLSRVYPNAFISLVAMPEVGTWVGATPEVLISVDKHQQFTTVALAGTQPKPPDMRLADAVWRQKEIEEQAMVSRYIINCLKRIRVREFEEIGPRTVAAANLLHLRTDFTIDLKEVNYPNLPTRMLELLHPTSAVCGLPKAPAAAFLEQHEALDRSFFAGFLGPVNLLQETHLFVNLRCMQLFADSAVLYAGAGITADSVPEREWQETEHKCQTLLDIIDNTST